MNISIPRNLVITTILLFIFSNPILSQKREPNDRIIEPDHTIQSKIMGKEYQLYISFPKNYSTKDSLSYPVLYVLDGRYSFPTINAARTAMDWGKELEDIIIVGIGTGLDFNSWYFNRYHDYTTSIDTTFQKEKEQYYGFTKGSLKSGGADRFLESIKKEIAPFVDKNYKTNSDRGLTGHSFGGLFTAYCFVNSDGYFTRFGINSPSLSWDNKLLQEQSVSQFIENKTWDLPPTKVYISVAENDPAKTVSTANGGANNQIIQPSIKT